MPLSKKYELQIEQGCHPELVEGLLGFSANDEQSFAGLRMTGGILCQSRIHFAIK